MPMLIPIPIARVIRRGRTPLPRRIGKKIRLSRVHELCFANATCERRLPARWETAKQLERPFACRSSNKPRHGRIRPGPAVGDSARARVSHKRRLTRLTALLKKGEANVDD